MKPAALIACTVAAAGMLAVTLAFAQPVVG
jgi:hypothetical protein